MHGDVHGNRIGVGHEERPLGWHELDWIWCIWTSRVASQHLYVKASTRHDPMRYEIAAPRGDFTHEARCLYLPPEPGCESDGLGSAYDGQGLTRAGWPLRALR